MNGARKLSGTGLAILAMLTFPWLGRGQAFSDSLDAIEVRARRIIQATPLSARWQYYSPGGIMDTLDTDQLNRYGFQTVDALLSDQYPVFVHRYGVNGMSSLRIRGASAAQTQVYWNGIPLQNPAHGQADLSTLAVDLMEEVRLLYGGGGALWGAGHMGGGLYLATPLAWADTGSHFAWRARLGAGSFGQRQTSIQGKGASGKWAYSLGAWQSQARNDFPYEHPEKGQRRMDHAGFRSRALIAQMGRRIRGGQIQTSFWWQNSYKELPAALFERYSVKTQWEHSYRWSMNLEKSLGRGRAFLIGGWTSDRSRYEDSAIDLVSGLQSHLFFAEAGWEQSLNKGRRLRVFIPVQFSFTRTGDDHRLASQHQEALGLAIHWPFDDHRWVAGLAARLASFDGHRLVLPSASIQFQPIEKGILTMNLQRSYRRPSLFERFLEPGGNPRLLPEQGWGMDLGAVYTLVAGSHQIRHRSTVFARQVQDWIIWMGGSIWTPHNLNAVFSRGWETDTEWRKASGPIQWTLGVRSAYIRSTQGPGSIMGGNLEGYQIPYSPRYRIQALGSAAWRKWSLQYTHGYTGYRFTSLDESQYLEPYDLGHFRLDWNWEAGSWTGMVQAQVLNCWNQDHRLAAYRPMPGRHWMLGIQCQWKSPRLP